MNHRKDDDRHKKPHSEGPYWKRAHRDWKMWIGVTLMLLGIIAYIMTLDESVRPGTPQKAPVPALP